MWGSTTRVDVLLELAYLSFVFAISIFSILRYFEPAEASVIVAYSQPVAVRVASRVFRSNTVTFWRPWIRLGRPTEADTWR